MVRLALGQRRRGDRELCEVHRREGQDQRWALARLDGSRLPAGKHLGVPPARASRCRTAGDPIDAFLGARLDALGLKPAPRGRPPDADPPRHVRPDRPAADAGGDRGFLTDPTPSTAFERVVDRLLASPALRRADGAGTGSTSPATPISGFANDYERGNAWRYRDYVVRSFNADKPYDRFVLEQIAGDEIDPDDPEMLVAAGFLRMGPWELTGMEVAKVARQRFLDDVTDAVGQVFLGHPLQCARCHDHKFDPIPTRDYYRIQAAFATTQLAERPAAFLTAENTAGFDEKKYLERRGPR